MILLHWLCFGLSLPLAPRVTQHTVRSLGRVYHIREWLGRDEPVGTLQKSGKLQASINIRRVITMNSKGVTEDKVSWSETAVGTPGGCRRLREAHQEVIPFFSSLRLLHCH